MGSDLADADDNMGMAHRITASRSWGERLASAGALLSLVVLVSSILWLAHNEQKKSLVLVSTEQSQGSIKQANALLNSLMRYISMRRWQGVPASQVSDRLDSVDRILRETQQSLWVTANRMDSSNDKGSLSFAFRLAEATGRMSVEAKRVVRSSPGGLPNRLAKIADERQLASIQLADAESIITTGMRRSLEDLMRITHYCYATVVVSLLAMAAFISVPIALRFKRIYGVMSTDQEELKKAYQEILENKCELQAKAVALEDAVSDSQAQSALFEHASNRFQQLFGGLPVGCMTVDVGGMVQEWNQAMSELTSIDSHIACYQQASLIFSSAGQNLDFDEIISKVITNGSKHEFEWEHRLLSGGKTHAFYTAYPLRNTKGAVLGAIVAGFNITERKKAEQALAESEQRFVTAMRASSTGIFEWYVQEDWQFWSPRVHEIFGTDEGSYVPGAYAISDRFVAGDREKLLHLVDLHTAGMEPVFSMEGRITRDNGEVGYIHIRGQAIRNESGEAVRVTGAIDDITDRKRAERALAESEKRFRDVTEAAGEFVFELNADGNFSFVTDRVESILGWNAQELIGKPAWFIIQDRVQEQGKAMQRLVFHRQVWPDGALAFARRKDGSDCHLQITALPMKSEEGAFNGFRGTALDITAQKQAEQDLANAHQMLHDTLQSIRDGFFSVDDQWSFVFANQTARDFFGSAHRDLAGRPIWDDLPESLREKFHLMAGMAIEQGEERTFEAWVPEHECWYDFRLYPRLSGATVFFQDISERKQFEEQIEAQMIEINEKNSILQLQQRSLEDANRRLAAMATTDGLTALKNHKAFQAALSELYEESIGLDSPISLILLDVDNFKRYNDTFGHPAGDDVLRMVAHILKQQGRRGDIVARYGGEEFVMVLPNTAAQDALTAAERIRQAIADHSWPNTAVTASFGVASTTAGARTRQDLIDQADAALYASKRGGRNRTTLWPGDSQLQASNRGKQAA